MKTVIFAAIAAACVSAPAFAQDAAPFTGPRAGVTAGYDKVEGRDGFSYGVDAGYDIALAPRIVGGVDVALADSTTGAGGVEASRDLSASLRLGYVATPKILAFGRVGYASSRFELNGGSGAALEGVRYGGGLEYSVTPHSYISAEYQRSEYEQNLSRDAGVVTIGYRF